MALKRVFLCWNFSYIFEKKAMDSKWKSRSKTVFNLWTNANNNISYFFLGSQMADEKKDDTGKPWSLTDWQFYLFSENI